MILYSNNEDQEIEGIEELELQHFGHQLVGFVNTYRRLIKIDDSDVNRNLDILLDIGTKIVNREYDKLFNDPSIVIPNYTQMTLQEFQKDLFSNFPFMEPF